MFYYFNIEWFYFIKFFFKFFCLDYGKSLNNNSSVIKLFNTFKFFYHFKFTKFIWYSNGEIVFIFWLYDSSFFVKIIYLGLFIISSLLKYLYSVIDWIYFFTSTCTFIKYRKTWPPAWATVVFVRFWGVLGHTVKNYDFVMIAY